MQNDTLIEDLLRALVDRLALRAGLPSSTYRLQFHAGFTFKQAAQIVPYLADLGITHVYASPIFTARPGSTHGYDVTDPNALNPELGTAADFQQLIDTLKDHAMKLIVDIVPNHMGVGGNDNAWWNDVLENGAASRYAGWFDIDWHLQDKVMLPILGEPYQQALEGGKLRVAHKEGRFVVQYYDRQLPIAPVTYPMIRADGEAIDSAVKAINGTPGDVRSFNRLDHLLNRQFYRLSFWRDAPRQINYRRFFDINDLAALRMERADTFDAWHALVFRLLMDEKIAGVRIDHPDGLYDPEGYFRRLQERYVEQMARHIGRTDPQFSALDWPQIEKDVTGNIRSIPLYAVAEKILATDESLPANWQVHGTTGYDFLNQINGLFVDPAAEPIFTHAYGEWIGNTLGFEEICYQKKRLILANSFTGDLAALGDRFHRLAQQSPNWRDLASASIREAIAEVIACFGVYRTYITDRGVSDCDAAQIHRAIDRALTRNPEESSTLFQFIRQTLLLEYPDDVTSDQQAEQCRAVGKFQQLTAPVTAKGVEDTAFYVYNRFVSLNEVGGDPARFGLAPAALHQWLGDRQTHWPAGLSPLSTHDTKRSEDVRARLNVLSEIPENWWRTVCRWARMNEPHRQHVDGKSAPDANEEYLLYQTLAGVWPVNAQEAPNPTFVQRIQDYLRKAMREAKVNTSWIDPNPAYEQAMESFIATILDPEKSQTFLNDFRSFHRRISHCGLLNSLAQTLLRLTAPGVPDTYQGTEVWDFSLVDPDNRRPVDYAQRLRMQAEFQRRMNEPGHDPAALARELIQSSEDGRVKLFVTRMALHCRREYPELFLEGSYIAIEIVGPQRDHVFAFARSWKEMAALVLVPRLMVGLISAGRLLMGVETWGDTAVIVPPGLEHRRFWNRFTGMKIDSRSDGGRTLIKVSDLLGDFPVALAIARTD